MALRRLVVVVFAVLAPLASVLAIPAAAQEEWPQYSRDDASGCDVTTHEDGAQDLSCDDGSYGAVWADGSFYWYDAASGCQIDVDTARAIVYDSCARTTTGAPTAPFPPTTTTAVQPEPWQILRLEEVTAELSLDLGNVDLLRSYRILVEIVYGPGSPLSANGGMLNCAIEANAYGLTYWEWCS